MQNEPTPSGVEVKRPTRAAMYAKLVEVARCQERPELLHVLACLIDVNFPRNQPKGVKPHKTSQESGKVPAPAPAKAEDRNADESGPRVSSRKPLMCDYCEGVRHEGGCACQCPHERWIRSMDADRTKIFWKCAACAAIRDSDPSPQPAESQEQAKDWLPEGMRSLLHRATSHVPDWRFQQGCINALKESDGIWRSELIREQERAKTLERQVHELVGAATYISGSLAEKNP